VVLLVPLFLVFRWIEGGGGGGAFNTCKFSFNFPGGGFGGWGETLKFNKFPFFWVSRGVKGGGGGCV